MTEMSLSEFAKKGPSASKRGGMSLLPVVIGAVILAGGGFLAGMQYQKGKMPTASAVRTASTQNGSGSGRAGGFGGGFQRGDRAFGTVSAISSTSITVQTRSGSTSTYNITSSTAVTDSGQTSSVSAIQTGDTVILTLDSSNTQNVTAILLNPSFGGGPDGPGGYSGQSDSSNSSSSDVPDTSNASSV